MEYTSPLNDQLETFLMRLIRGSSLSGLGDMQPFNGLYLRPLLQVPKSQILEYLVEHNLEYVIDPTNQSNLFLRNRIRKVIPNLQAIDNRLEHNFTRTLIQVQQANQFIERQTNLALDHVVIRSQIDLKKLFILDQFLQNQVILTWLYQSKVQFTPSESLLREIFKFLNSPNGGTHQIYPNWKLEKKQNLLSLSERTCHPD